MIDFLVIGGGVAGLGAGASLSSLGKVLVLERETATGMHASGRSAAMFEENYGLPATLALNRASADHHRHANGGYLSPRGLLLVATRDEAADFHADVETLQMDPIPLDQALALVPILDPDRVDLCAHAESAFDIDTHRLMQDFAHRIRANGGQVRTGAEVTSIRRDGPAWQVTGAHGQCSARIVVNAAGAWADRVAGLAGIAPIGITPYRRSMARLPAPEGHDLRAWPMLMGVNESWYAKPDAGAWLVSPADEDPMDPQDAWPDDMVLAEGIARYQSMVRSPVTRVTGSWAGLRSFAPDRTLVLGPDPDQPAFLWCAGQGGYGFQTAPAASQLLADLVAGTPPVLDADVVRALRPDRLR